MRDFIYRTCCTVLVSNKDVKYTIWLLAFPPDAFCFLSRPINQLLLLLSYGVCEINKYMMHVYTLNVVYLQESVCFN